VDHGHPFRIFPGAFRQHLSQTHHGSPAFEFFISLTQERKKIQQNKGGPDHLNACIHDFFCFFLDCTSHFFYNVSASGKPFMRAQGRQGFPGFRECRAL
jgi:hypothetical protein